MKVGLSFSRCLRDIVEAKVLYEDVLVIVARTDFNPHDDKHWSGIWSGYRQGGGFSNPEWASSEPGVSEEEVEAMYRNVAKQLYDGGKLHQPRQFGAHPSRLPYYWLDTFAPMEEIANNPATVKAWENYKMLAGLSTKTRTVKDDF
jgi:hypothetical protein